LLLCELGLSRRQKRLKGGSMVIDNNKIQFTLDENSLPTAYSIETRKEANFVVEEFMLLANQIVAKKLVEYD
jgi:exoribonuclease R